MEYGHQEVTLYLLVALSRHTGTGAGVSREQQSSRLVRLQRSIGLEVAIYSTPSHRVHPRKGYTK